MSSSVRLITLEGGGAGTKRARMNIRDPTSVLVGWSSGTHHIVMSRTPPDGQGCVLTIGASHVGYMKYWAPLKQMAATAHQLDEARRDRELPQDEAGGQTLLETSGRVLTNWASEYAEMRPGDPRWDVCCSSDPENSVAAMEIRAVCLHLVKGKGRLGGDLVRY